MTSVEAREIANKANNDRRNDFTKKYKVDELVNNICDDIKKEAQKGKYRIDIDLRHYISKNDINDSYDFWDGVVDSIANKLEKCGYNAHDNLKWTKELNKISKMRVTWYKI